MFFRARIAAVRRPPPRVLRSYSRPRATPIDRPALALWLLFAFAVSFGALWLRSLA